ncbi:hypothetical protein C1645_879423 [Glomus cerebriforme]|uniref:HMG box domain-containing protein n=1 Tax=Glomus cerebriforme TaxID=658196 RepID=A0A397SGT9_9GLOM|nr:hypothetical protein C1645_879423 [Glomus cerebriforme]
MSQYKSKVNGKVVQAFLDLRGKYSFVVVKLDDGVQFDFPVPTIQEIRDRFFFKRAKTQPDKPARPPNKFFIFRTIFQAAIYNLKLQVPVVSGLASEVWRKCTPEVIELFTKLSNTAKIEHGQINPGYVYKPNRKPRATRNQTNPGILMSPSISLSCSPTAPIWTSPSRTNSFLRQESRPPISFALQTNSFTTIENYQAIYPSQYAYATIDPSIHYMPPNDQYQHSQHPTMYIPHNEISIDQLNTFRNPNNSYTHDISHSIPAPIVDYSTLCRSKGNDLLSMRKSDNVTSKEPSLTDLSSGQHKILRGLYPEHEDKTSIVVQKMENNH